jgi:protein-arginine kinase activator protein McsA
MEFIIQSFCETCGQTLFCTITKKNKTKVYYCDKCPFSKCKTPNRRGYGAMAGHPHQFIIPWKKRKELSN